MLKPSQDAYGQMMLDYLGDGSGYEVVEHDDGFVAIGAGPRLYFADFDAWRQTERDAMELVGGRVLDIGCGAGRFGPNATLSVIEDAGHGVYRDQPEAFIAAVKAFLADRAPSAQNAGSDRW